MPTDPTPIFVRLYDFVLWLLPQTAKFPRARRHTLTNRIEGSVLDLQSTLARANRLRGPLRLAMLDEADGILDGLRFLVRLATDLRHLSDRQYEFASGKLTEIGRLLGAWRKVTLPAAPPP